MPQNTYYYEQPLNERVRTLLRIEALVQQLDYLKVLDSDIASYHALLKILEVTSLVERGDVKQEVIKELERQHKVLNDLVSNENVDKSRLELTLSRLKNALTKLHHMDGKLGEHLKVIDFLLTIKQRASIPGGSCEFDLPQLRYWLNLKFESRLEDITRWSAPYYKVYEAISLILSIIRDSAHAETIQAQNGFFQESLDTSLANQLIRIELDKDSNIFPEISAGKHRYTIRFLKSQQTIDKVPVQRKENIEFKLYRCAL